MCPRIETNRGKRGVYSMTKGRSIAQNVFSVGAVDWDRRLFDELVALPSGTSYNAYLVVGSEKTALVDTVDPTKFDDLKENLDKLSLTKLDYVISNHGEQDHSGCIPYVLERFPDAILVCNKLNKKILMDEHTIEEKRIKVIEDMEELSLGDRTLQFIFTPWVHWPETMCTFLKEEGILFTCDFFGSHLATSDLFVKDTGDIHEPAKRYYAEIMMPFANIIQRNIAKVRKIEGLHIIAPSHGPMYKNPAWIIDKYDEWTSPKAKKQVVVAYASMHGSTKKMAEHLVHTLIDRGMHVTEFNLTQAEIGKIAIAMVDASSLVVASPTFLGGMHPVVASTLYTVNALHPKTLLLSYIGSDEWGGKVLDEYKQLTSNFKATYIDGPVIKGHPSAEDYAKLDELADQIIAKHDDFADKLVEEDEETEGSLSALTQNASSKVSADNTNNNNNTVLQNIPTCSFENPTDKDLSIVLAGEAGQGIMSIQAFLMEMLKQEGYYVFSTTEYMSRVRGGSNSVTIRVSSSPRIGNIDRVDLLLPLDKDALPHMEKRLSKETVIIGDKSIVKSDHTVIDIPFIEMAGKIGQKIFANTIATGVVLGLLHADIHHFYKALTDKFSRKGEDVVNKNLEAAKQGYEVGERLRSGELADFVHSHQLKKSQKAYDTMFLGGAEAISYGAIAGGCNFISAYPMSPSTGVLVHLAKHRFDFDIVVEQAEDEIGAINMGIGAWYAGARALVNSSGGGFALMTEAVSLAGMIESPLVVHIAQRPGPATGLPTRTAQEDLNLVLYAGHGEFCRVIYAPATVVQGVELTQKAFNVADAYQIPVFVLTDQYFMDTLHNIPPIDVDAFTNEYHIIQTDEGYLRYSLTESGISPRGIPGHGKGLVCADSDEHDESGHITESADVRVAMMDKRHKRFAVLEKECIAPMRFGNDSYAYLVIAWGTTYGSIKEALDRMNRDDICYVHYTQLYPLHSATAGLISRAEKTVVVEGNFTGQFADLIKRETGLSTEKLCKYDGMQFTVEELMNEFSKRFQK